VATKFFSFIGAVFNTHVPGTASNITLKSVRVLLEQDVGMWNVLLILCAITVITALFFKLLDDVLLPDSKKAALQHRFELWWLAIAEANTSVFATALATKVAQATDLYFGSRLLSKRAFRKSFVISTSLLALLLGLSGIRSGQPLGIAPWQSFQETVAMLERVWSVKASAPKLIGPPTQAQMQAQQAEDQLKTIVRQFSSPTWICIHSVSSLLALILLNSLLFFSSLVYSRMVLREIAAAPRVFSAATLLLANFALVLPTWTIVFLLEMIIFTPLLWFCIPLAYVLSRISLYWFLAFGLGGSVAGLAFGSPILKAVSLLGFLPCLFALGMTALSGLALLSRNLFHKTASSILLRFADKGPLKVAVAVLLFGAGTIAALFQLLRYWK
jgi:hypothetical protein